MDDVLGRWNQKAKVYSSESYKKTDSKLLAIFSKYDPNASGKIKAQDFTSAMRELGVEMDPARMPLALENAGLDKGQDIELRPFVKMAEFMQKGVAGNREQNIGESLWELLVLVVQQVFKSVQKATAKQQAKDATSDDALTKQLEGQNVTGSVEEEEG